ncbi:MAG: twin-arginine translocation signal domain-containing protein [Candidatus Hydrogenedentes bacterium]|nr:twin-arginine translocation signal domain-containing protein [Candidatus Hydrogenedentota bacterium]
MSLSFTRRDFLARSGAAITLAATSAHSAPQPSFPIADLHVHLDNSTIDDVLRLSTERKVTFGIVEHAGTKENKYPVILSNDDELKAYLAMLDGKPVYRGVQAEWKDWSSCFSKDVLAQLDFVLSDAMTWPGPDGARQKLWEPGLEIGDPQVFMDKYVDWHVEVMETQPLDIFANTSWLPEKLLPDYDTLWTEARVAKVVDAAVKNGVALEISSAYQLPKLPFLRQAKAAGVRFSYGSNGRYPKMGLLEYSTLAAAELGLTQEEIFLPAPDGQKAVQRRMK